MQNEPVLNNGLIAAIVLIAGPWLGRWGIDTGGFQAILGVAAGVISGAIAIWRFVVARGKVTPVANPVSSAGVPLLPATPPA